MTPLTPLTVTCLLSAILCFVFALTIFTLRRSARILQEKNWANPFGLTFFVFTGMYALRFFALLFQDDLSADRILTINAVRITASGVTTYLIMLAAFRLAEPSLHRREALRKILVEYRYLTLLVLCAAGFLQIVPEVLHPSKWVQISMKLPDNAFSAVALFSMGFVLFQNIHFRRDKFMARLVLWSSAAYAILFLALFANEIIGWTPDGWDKDLFTVTVAFLLKLGLFFPAFSLLLLDSAPLVGIERLLESITRKNKEYLESEGIVKSIHDELHLDRVDLYVRLPGGNENRIARFSYPKLSDDQDPQVFEYQEGTGYDRVFKTKEPEIVNRDDYSYRFLHRISTVSVPILFHSAVIACLRVEVGEEKFTEIDLNNLKRIAIMISPAVQTYRETFALNKLSHDLSALQIKVKKFDLQRDINDICERIHNVTSSTVVGLSIEAGFSEYHGVFPHHESLETSVNELFHAALESKDFRSADGTYRWFVNELKMTPPAELAGEQVFGRFIFGIEENQPGKHPPLGTSQLYRQNLNDLVNDTLLDFIRGHLNQLTDKLGEKLSGLKRTELKVWHAAVEEMAQKAKLSWVVVSRFDRSDERLGAEQAVQLINSIELFECKDKWEKTESGFSLYRVDKAGVSCVIRKKLTQSGETIWFGITQARFGPELNFISPWAYFLDHFCAIADSSLKLLKDRKHHEVSLKSVFDMAIVVHQLVRLARSIHNTYEDLNRGLDNGSTIASSEIDKALSKSSQRIQEFKQVLETISDPDKRDERVGFSVGEVLDSVCEEFNGRLSQHDIKFAIKELQRGNRKIPLGVPFYAVENALWVTIENALDALRAQSPNGHKRRIIILIDNSAEQGLICKVVDNGPGIPPHIAAKLFIQPCPTSKLNSNGFGLFSAFNLLWVFDGSICYNRRRVNKKERTVFQIILPRDRTKQ